MIWCVLVGLWLVGAGFVLALCQAAAQDNEPQ